MMTVSVIECKGMSSAIGAPTRTVSLIKGKFLLCEVANKQRTATAHNAYQHSRRSHRPGLTFFLVFVDVVKDVDCKTVGSDLPCKTC